MCRYAAGAGTTQRKSLFIKMFFRFLEKNLSDPVTVPESSGSFLSSLPTKMCAPGRRLIKEAVASRKMPPLVRRSARREVFERPLLVAKTRDRHVGRLGRQRSDSR